MFKKIIGKIRQPSPPVAPKPPEEEPSKQKSRPTEAPPPKNREKPRPASGARKPSRKRARRSGQNPEGGGQAARRPKKTQEMPPPRQVEPKEGETRFLDLDLPRPVQAAIDALDFEYCTPIQADILPHTLAGRDAAGRAQTGTGKTAAFLTSIFTRFLRDPAPAKRASGTPRALVMAPTRELALQIENDARNLNRYAGFKIISVYGGMDYNRQEEDLRGAPVDLIVATPGRLLDFMGKRVVNLGKLEILVIDEADRMLDMGFIPDMRRIIRATPPKEKRQTMLFSATLTPEVTNLISRWTRRPVFVEIEPEQVVVDTVEQVVYITTAREKFKLLYNLITNRNLHRVLVFCNRRDQVRRLQEKLEDYGLKAALLSGEVPQKKRLRTLEGFRGGAIRVLVATDVASRGIHVEDISHVINFNLPFEADDYVHRIGRTGRAGQEGTSVSFACDDDAFQIPAIEEYIGESLTCRQPEEDLLQTLPRVERRKHSGPKGGRRDSRSGGSRSRSQGRRRR